MNKLGIPGNTMTGMKYKMWKYRGKQFSFKVNYLDDVLSILRFKKRSFKDFKGPLWNKQGKRSQEIRKRHIYRFF